MTLADDVVEAVHPRMDADRLDCLKPELEARIKTWIDEALPVAKMYHTLGLYPDGSTKSNLVATEDLAIHLEYNLVYRPGRALFVDGICINRGMLSDDRLNEMSVRLLTNPVEKTKGSVVYH